MFRKISETFTATHLTAIIIAAIVTPGAVYAVSTTAVAITDPIGGHQAAVDAGRRLYTYDPIAGYGNNPANFVQVANSCNANAAVDVYDVPSGKALIIKTVGVSYHEGTSGYDNFVAMFSSESNSALAFEIEDPNVVGSHQVALGSGYVVRAGQGVYCYSSVPAVVTMQGYFVPTNAIAAAGTPEAAQQNFAAGNKLIRGRPQ